MDARRRAVIAGLMSWLILCKWGGSLAAETEMAAPDKADRILVMKARRRLYLFKDGRTFRDYPIGLGPNPIGPKIFELDGRTPEGLYVVDLRIENSAYFRSLHISYPCPDDSARAAKYGMSPGGNIAVHGTPDDGGQFLGDWTDGCIAVTNAAMREIWDAVDIGTPIEIRP